MRSAYAFTAIAAIAVLTGCASSKADVAPLSVPRQVSWATYQHSGDRNAIFPGYTLPGDWSYDAKSKINSGLALSGNTLLFTTFSRRLVALDVRTGRELWHAPVSNIAMSTPIVAGNLVYVGTGKSGILDRTLLQKMRYFRKEVWGVPGGDEMAAFNVRTGAPVWTYRTDGEDMPSPVYYDGRLIFANGDRHAYGLRADTGRQLWATDIGGISTMASAVMAGNAAVVGICTHGMRESYAVALDPATGKILWRSPYGHCDAAPAYADGKVFVSTAAPGATSLEGKAVAAALDPKTGKALWVYRDKVLGLWSSVGTDEAAIAGTYADGTFYQPAPFTDDLLAIDAKTGKLRWRFNANGPIKMSPVVLNGRVYAGDSVGFLYTIAASDGRLLELRAFKDAFTASPPIIAGNKLLVVNGTSVDAIPLTGRPKIGERVGWSLAPHIHLEEKQ